MIGFDGWAKEAKDQAKKWDDAAAKIKSGEAKTLTEVGEGIKKETDARKKAEENNKAAAAKHAESISKLSTVTTNAMDVEKTARAISAARQAQPQVGLPPKQIGALATPAPDVKAPIATPVAEPVKPLAPVGVNRTAAAQQVKTQEQAAQEPQQPAPDALLVLTQKIIELLQQSYQAENRQGELLAQLLMAMGKVPASMVPRVEDGVYGIVKR
jgi:hypothetical protein